MSRLRLGKKLQPAKKAWKSFSKTVQSKVNKLNIPKAFKATLQHLLATFHTLCHLITSRTHRSFAAKTKGPYAAASSYYLIHGKNIPAIHIDDLFAEPASSSSLHVHHAMGKISRGKEVVVVEDEKDSLSGNGELDTIEDAWKAVVAKSPLLRVDERAEEFISKFHEDMKLQKERSLMEFQEMLARGV